MIGPPLWVRETKTSSENLDDSSTYWRRLILDSQVSTYILAGKALGYNVVGCLYDVLRTPALKPKMATPVELRKYTKKTGELHKNQREQDETPEEFFDRCLKAIESEPDKYFKRAEVVRLEEEDREAALDIWQTSLAMKMARHLNIYPRNPDACVHFNRVCEYFPICTGQASKNDPILFEKVVPEDLHATMLSQSSIKNYRRCPRLFQLRSVEGVRSKSRFEVFRRGKSVHGAIEVLCKTRNLAAAIDSLDKTDPWKNAKERAMIVGYLAMWSAPWGVVATEKQFNLSLIDPETGEISETFTICGSMDAIVTADQRHLQPQMLTQQLEASLAGPEPEENDAQDVQNS